MERYDIYEADFPFEEVDKSKIRPALVITEIANEVVALKITSVGRTGDTQSPILEWEAAGLTKPSYIYFDKSFRIERDKFTKKIGHLQLNDILALEEKLTR